MLTENPKVNQIVEVVKTGMWSDTGERYQTAGDIHFIKGTSEVSGNPYFIGDMGMPIYIDEASHYMYNLLEPDVETSDKQEDIMIRLSVDQFSTLVAGLGNFTHNENKKFHTERGWDLPDSAEEMSELYQKLLAETDELYETKHRYKKRNKKTEEKKEENSDFVFEDFRAELGKWLENAEQKADDTILKIEEMFNINTKTSKDENISTFASDLVKRLEKHLKDGKWM